MSGSQLFSSSFLEQQKIEYAIHDFKRGVPIFIKTAQETLLHVPLETIHPDMLQTLRTEFPGQWHLIVPQKRAEYLNTEIKNNALAIDISDYSNEELAAISCQHPCPVTLAADTIRSASESETSGIMLSQFAEIMPAILCYRGEKKPSLLEITATSLHNYNEKQYHIIQSAQTALPLKWADKCSIHAFRQQSSAREHYAIVVGEIGEAPLVRVHSSCYTGDLLASLACDCQDQLHSAIEKMADEDGGIVLYILQEGRGIGLINKLRAYELKAKGFDTVDANQALGFNDDQRAFTPAARMLEHLKVSQVRLLSNNPRKAKGLEAEGITVVETVSHQTEHNHHNREYLNTKATRLGHDMKRD